MKTSWLRFASFVVTIGVFSFMHAVQAQSVTSLDPQVIDTVNGTALTVAGSDFGDPPGVKTNTQRLLVGTTTISTSNGLQSWTPTSIMFVAPTSLYTQSSPLQIVLQNVKTKLKTSGPLVYLQPSVTSLKTPSRVAPDLISVQSLLTIAGKHFTATKGKVVFAGGAEGTVISWTDTLITATVPAGAVSGGVTVKVFNKNTGTYSIAADSPTSVEIMPQITNDPFTRDNQWWLVRTHAAGAWATTTGNKNIVVAVIDSGVNTQALDFTFNIWKNPRELPGNGRDDDGNGLVDDTHGWNFLKNSPDLTPPNSHGTEVAGIIAAQGNNGVGVAGLAWKTTIMPLIACNASDCPADKVGQAIRYAVDNGAQIINLSTYGPSTAAYSTKLDAAIRYAFLRGALVVAAAGNSTDTGTDPKNLNVTPSSPVCNNVSRNMVLGVTATDRTDVKSSFANYGSDCVDIAAPGSGIFTTVRTVDDPTNKSGVSPLLIGYGKDSGTGLAAAVVSGVAALVEAKYPAANSVQVADMIRRSADPIDAVNPLYAGHLGAGRVNAAAAVALVPDPALADAVPNARTRPNVAGITVKNGTYALLVGKQTVKLRPFGAKYGGAVAAWKVSFNVVGQELYVFAAGAKSAASSVKVYNAKGKLMQTLKPYVAGTQAGLTAVMTVEPLTNRLYLAVGSIGKSGKVIVFQGGVTGFRPIQQLTAGAAGSKTIVKFLKLDPDEYALVTMMSGKPASMKIWSYDDASKRFFEDTATQQKRVTVNGDALNVK